MRRWAAPTPAGPVVAQVSVPGSKSATARAFVLAALADGPSVLSGVLDARDSRLMRAALTSLGVVMDDLAPGVVRVTPPAAFRDPPFPLPPPSHVPSPPADPRRVAVFLSRQSGVRRPECRVGCFNAADGVVH